MSEEKVTREDIEKKTEELCKMIEDFDGSKPDAAAYVCGEVVTWSCYNHFEGLGILTEVLMEWRNTSIDVLNEENTPVN